MDCGFTVPRLAQRLDDDFAITAGDRIAVAYSGGIDSSVLLNAMCEIADTVPFTLRALHVDHGLHPQSRQWSAHCELVCERLNIPLQIGRVDLSSISTGVELAARNARYEWFESVLHEGEILALAHHADDQLETLLFRLVRGAGARGMQGMTGDSEKNGVRLIRPLLDFSRTQLRHWAVEQQLQWIDDPANKDSDFDRVYLRHHVIPELTRRWPGAAQQAVRSSRYITDVVAIADRCAVADLLAARPSQPLFGGGPGLSCKVLSSLPPERLNHALRLWCLQLASTPLPRGRLHSLTQMVLSSTAAGEVRFGNILIRRYRDGLFIQRILCQHEALTFEPQVWNETMSPIDVGDFQLQWTLCCGAGVSQRLLHKLKQVTLRPIKPDDRVNLMVAGHRKSLKQLCQRFAVPVWDRASLLLLAGSDGEHVAVAGVCTDDRWAANNDEMGVSFQLIRRHGLDLH